MAFQKHAVIFSLWLVLSVMAVAAQYGDSTPGDASAPSQAPNQLASPQAMLMGFMGVSVSFLFFKSVA